jgi:trehalose-6-phosphate synthase
MRRQLAFHELCALYAVTDVALVTSLRDGMNLVSYEYVACQSDNAGAQLAPMLESAPTHAEQLPRQHEEQPLT